MPSARMSCVSIVALASSARPTPTKSAEVEHNAAGEDRVVDLLVRRPAHRSIAVAHGGASAPGTATRGAGSDWHHRRRPSRPDRDDVEDRQQYREREPRPPGGAGAGGGSSIDSAARRRVAMGVALDRRRRAPQPAPQQERPQQRARRKDQEPKADRPFPRGGIDDSGAAPDEEDANNSPIAK